MCPKVQTRRIFYLKKLNLVNTKRTIFREQDLEIEIILLLILKNRKISTLFWAYQVFIKNKKRKTTIKLISRKGFTHVFARSNQSADQTHTDTTNTRQDIHVHQSTNVRNFELLRGNTAGSHDVNSRQIDKKWLDYYTECVISWFSIFIFHFIIVVNLNRVTKC